MVHSNRENLMRTSTSHRSFYSLILILPRHHSLAGNVGREATVMERNGRAKMRLKWRRSDKYIAKRVLMCVCARCAHGEGNLREENSMAGECWMWKKRERAREKKKSSSASVCLPVTSSEALDSLARQRVLWGGRYEIDAHRKRHVSHTCNCNYMQLQFLIWIDELRIAHSNFQYRRCRRMADVERKSMQSLLVFPTLSQYVRSIAALIYLLIHRPPSRSHLRQYFDFNHNFVSYLDGSLRFWFYRNWNTYTESEKFDLLRLALRPIHPEFSHFPVHTA